MRYMSGPFIVEAVLNNGIDSVENKTQLGKSFSQI